jgi:putative protease
LIDYIDKIIDSGVDSLKIEGRMKSPYYVATVVNAYRRAIDYMLKCKVENKKYATPKYLKDELEKASHRKYTTGFMFNDNNVRQNYESSIQEQNSKFMAIVIGKEKGRFLVEQRNKFAVGDSLEILSPGEQFNKQILIEKMTDENNTPIDEAKNVQQKIWIYSNAKIDIGDILRK